MEKQTFKFEIVITGISQAVAEMIHDEIIVTAVQNGGEVGGGFKKIIEDPPGEGVGNV